MKEQDSSNLFDLSQGNTKKPASRKLGIDPEGDAMQNLKIMNERHLEIQQRMDDAFQKSGVDPKDLDKYCENPNNFTPSQWSRLQHQQEEIEMILTGLSKESLAAQKELKVKSRVDKARKGKTLGARKNWLNMH